MKLRIAGLFGGWKRLSAVNLTHRQLQSARLGELNGCKRALRRDGLSVFVVADIALRAADAFRQCGLRQVQHVSDGFDLVHADILAALILYVNSGADYFFDQRRYCVGRFVAHKVR